VLTMKLFLLCMVAAVAVGSPAAELDAGMSLQGRETQILSIVEGARQLALLLTDSWNTGARAARALKSTIQPSNVARALQEQDPVESSLAALDLNTEVCRSRVICELQTKLTDYSMGDLVYEFFKRKAPKLKKYGVVTARDLGVNSCYEAFPCRASTSPLMEKARHLRMLVEDFCDLSGKSMTSSFCRGIKYAVDKMETL